MVSFWRCSTYASAYPGFERPRQWREIMCLLAVRVQGASGDGGRTFVGEATILPPDQIVVITAGLCRSHPASGTASDPPHARSQPPGLPEPPPQDDRRPDDQRERRRISVRELQLGHVLEVHPPDAREGGGHREDRGPRREAL